MATIAYASSAAAPKISQSDKVIDLSQGAPPPTLPVAAVNLFSDAEDTGDPGATFGYEWIIVDQPAASLAQFSNEFVQNPTFGPIDVWGNYRLMVVATSTGPGGASESEYHRAPNTAFVTIRVRSAQAALEKPASFERDWTATIHRVIAAVEAGVVLPPHLIEEHTDSVDVTGPKLQPLVTGGLATFGGNPLHLHKGTDVEAATPTDPGTLVLSEVAVDPLNPVALNEEHFKLQAMVDGSHTFVGYQPGVVVDQSVAGHIPAWFTLWYADRDMTIESFQVVMQDGGPDVGGGDVAYEFSLLAGDEAAVHANLLALISAGGGNDAVVGGATYPTVDHGPLVLNSVALGVTGQWTVAAGRYVAFVCTASPVDPGGGLTVQINCRRNV